jgi:hypothetical protein
MTFFLVFQSHFFILSFELPGLTKRLIISFYVFLLIWAYDRGSAIQCKCGLATSQNSLIDTEAGSLFYTDIL